MKKDVTLSSFDTDYVIECIENNSCIFFLGPNAFKITDGSILRNAFFDYLKNEVKLNLNHDEDFLVAFDKNKDKIRFQAYLRKFYQECEVEHELFEKLAQLPIGTFINVSPDHILSATYENLNLDHDFYFYNKKTIESGNTIAHIHTEKPLVYNLFGSILEPDSLIVTHEDIFEFIFSLIGKKKKLPEELLAQIYDTRLFVFLGFEFETWYLRLILRIFHLHEDENMGVASVDTKSLNANLKQFYENNFEIEFIDSDIEMYVDAIFQHFQKKGKLNKQKSDAAHLSLDLQVSEVQNKLRVLVGKDELETAIKLLDDFYKEQETEEYHEVIFMSGKYARIMKNHAKGLIEDKELEHQLSQIRHMILSMIPAA